MKREVNRRVKKCHGKRPNGNKFDRRHSRRLVNERKVMSEALPYIKQFMTKLGKTVRIGYMGDDFIKNRVTLRQYVRIPRILSPAKNN